MNPQGIVLLYVFPSMDASSDYARGLAARIHAAAAPGTTVRVATVAGAPAHLETFYNRAHLVPRLLQTVADSHEPFQALIVGCFTDPGVDALREVVSVPVIGIGEASMYVACGLGYRFSVVIAGDKYAAATARQVRLLGLDSRLASVEVVAVNVLDLRKGGEREKAAVVEACRRAARNGADAIVMGCGTLGRYARHVQAAWGKPVVDPVTAGVKLAEVLAFHAVVPTAAGVV